MGCARSKPVPAPPDNGVFFKTYRVGKKLGDGAYGQVRTAEDRVTGEEYAVKIIDVRKHDSNGKSTTELDQKRSKSTRSEIALWKEVGRHEHCVQLYRTFLDSSLCYMVMDRCRGGSIMDKMLGMQQMTKGDLAMILRAMLLGLEHVHQVGIVHRDIKPDNFLFGGSSGMTVKLCDFGLATRMPKKGVLNGVYGTAPYMSPEMLARNGYDHRTDIWSFGATAHLMLCGTFPYNPPEPSPVAMKQAIVADDPRLVVLGTNSDARFLRTLLHRDYQSRVSASEALEMPFISEPMSHRGQSVKPTITQALKLNGTCEEPVSVTVQKSIDELLTKLHEASPAGSPLRYFSEITHETVQELPKEALQAPEARDRSSRRRSPRRHSTHSGAGSDMGSPLASHDLGSDIGQEPSPMSVFPTIRLVAQSAQVEVGQVALPRVPGKSAFTFSL